MVCTRMARRARRAYRANTFKSDKLSQIYIDEYCGMV